MPLLIQTTGLEEYAPGGTARIKVMVIGGPGAGKTRWSSFFPKPIYADCERGLASVADRNVPFVNIRNSQDMIDLLAHLKQESAQPWDKRRFQTVVIDTLDAFQRKVKNEWMEKEKAQAFSGWEAWGYLNARMQLLMTRLLNLDMNIIVNVHYKDKTVKDKDGGGESHELMLQLQGESADTAFNDFDLVGWMGTYWESEEGQRVQKRGLTFKPTPEKPFLKDRLHVTPTWLEVQFADTDYEGLFSRVQNKLESLDASSVIGEVETGENPSGVPGYIVTPGALGSGPVPSADVSPPPLTYAQMDKPTLAKLARDRGVTTLTDGAPIRGNTLKAELIAALEAADVTQPDPPAAPQQPTPEPAASTPAASEPAAATPDPPAEPSRSVTRRKSAPKDAKPVPASNEKHVEGVGTVDTSTGEISEHESATAVAEQVLGAKVIEEIAAPAEAATVRQEAPEPQPQAEPAKAGAPEGEVCEDCGKSLAEENPDFVKLSYIKYRKRLCENDYRGRKSGAR